MSTSIKTANNNKDQADLDALLIRFILENANDAVYIYDENRDIMFVNNNACRETGYSREELLQMNISDLDPHYPVTTRAGFRERADKGEKIVFETEHTSRTGEKRPVEVSLAVTIFNGKAYNSALVRDISERLKVETALRHGEERFRVISDASPVALIISKISDGNIQYVNRQAEVLFEMPSEKLQGTAIQSLLQNRDVENQVVDILDSGTEVHNMEILLHDTHDIPLWISLNTRIIELEGEQVICSAMLDITEARELSNQLSYQATYDDLTGLVNRREFEDRLQEVIEIAEERKSQNVLCYLDLDQFKIINDTCGHMAGDELLKQLAQVLFKCIRRDDTLARLGGDEFAILLENCPLDHAIRIANNVRQVVQEFRFVWQENSFNIGVSIGVTPITIDGDSISDVLRRADSACYAAKDKGRNRVHVYQLDDEELAHRHGEMKWVAKIHAALEEDRFDLWHQEIAEVDQETASIKKDAKRHFEILVRMRDENGGLILPDHFLPAAERYDLAPKIDRWVVRKAFQWLEEHPEEVEHIGILSINLSGQTLSDETFLKEIDVLFENSEIPAQKICFEITETAAISHLARATQFMKTLKSKGCTFALDDFGSGLSSFAYLKTLPVDFVKIDGFFVKDVMTDSVDLAMVKAINDMAHAMGKITIAEFVEDDYILQELIELGVDYVQGFGIGKPVPLTVS